MSTASNAAVGRGVLKVVAATAAYGALHTGLASETAKGWAEQAVGRRVRNAFYRPMFNAVAGPFSRMRQPANVASCRCSG